MYLRQDGEREGEQSLVTCMLYLSEGFKGGETRFLDKVDVVPKTGSVLLFDHPILHEGCEVQKGRKYCIRTDVMYAEAASAPDYLTQPPQVETPDPFAAS